ncbi:MAG: phosphate acyltransferase [Elusimicrobiaceae bacterium]
MFKDFDEIIAQVRGKTNRVAVPGANNTEALEALKMADGEGLIASGYLIGDPALIKDMARAVGLSLGKFEIIDCRDGIEMCNTAVRLVTEGKADFLVKGLVDTKYYMKAILNKEAGLVEPGALLSHFALIKGDAYKKLFAITDAAILISPDVEQKAKILNNAVGVMRRLGVEQPKVSVVCPVEKVNPAIPSTVDAQALVEMNRVGKIPYAVVEGPYDLYITLSRTMADEKGIKGGVVPGDVDIMLLPDLDAANPLYKGICFFGAGIKAATILIGAKVPAILPSRADSPSTKLNAIALAAYLKRI